MNALDLLISDHQKVKGLFDRIEQCADLTEKREVFDQIRMELETHAHIEESIFYPTFSEYEELADLIEEAYADHEEVRSLLEEIEDLEDEDEFDSAVDELIDAVETHVEIEEDEFFPKVLEVSDATKLDQLGAQLQEAKDELPRAA